MINMQSTTSSIPRPGLPRVVGAAHSATAALLDEPIQPIPKTLKQDPVRAAIGRQLFSIRACPATVAWFAPAFKIWARAALTVARVRAN